MCMEATMKYKIEDINIEGNGKKGVPDAINFVWIGDITRANLEYMNIWKETNPDKEIYLWVDDSSYIFNFFHEVISEFVSSQQTVTKQELEIEIKNKAYEYISNGLKSNIDLSTLVMSFLTENKINDKHSESFDYNRLPLLKGIQYRDINDLFTSDFHELKKFYYYELILRGNFASASDIVRLIIIYQYGGFYLDMDTLPETDYVFEKLNCYLNEKNMAESDFTFSLKTKLILNKLGLINPKEITEKESYGSVVYLSEIDFDKIIHLAHEDLYEFSIEKILPLGKIYVHKNLFSLGSLKNLKGAYFNSFIASHAKSKGLNIIIRTMKKRYKFIEKNNCIFMPFRGSKNTCYLTRILTWRTELYTRDYVVTSALTGPGLLVECLLGIAYHLLDLSPSLNPSSLAVELQNEKYGIALFQHNLYTPDGNDSSWRN